MPTAADVYNQIQAFFRNPPLPLLEQLCRGKPEIIIQKLLFAHLQNSFGLTQVKKEVRYTCHVQNSTGDKPSFTVIDFIVLDDNLSDIICCIELKHYSANQGRLKRLLSGGINRNGKQQRFHLDDDFQKCRPCVPLIQIGIFSAVEGISSVAPKATFSGHPFIQKYVLKRSGKQYALPGITYWRQAQVAFAGWLANQALNRYTTPSNPAQMSDLIFGQTQSFRTASGVQVTGRVNYFIGLTKLFPEKFPCSEAGAKIDDGADTREL